jgi:hypothetical protein
MSAARRIRFRGAAHSRISSRLAAVEPPHAAASAPSISLRDYQVRDDEIVIVAVAHLHRQPRYWRDRIKD